MREDIFIKGAREHNLKNIDISIPRDKLVVVTGLSGSGKSSLAFDTIYAEGRRRYVESLSSYARQFLGQMSKPDLDFIEGLSPAISIDQKGTSHNPRSTVGTVTEVYDYLRLLYASIGVPHCYSCGKEISQQTVDQMVDRIIQLGEGTRIQVLAPVVRSRKGEYNKLIQDIKKGGYSRIRVDGITYDADDAIELDKNKKHDIEVIVDRLVVKPDMGKRLTDSIETVLKLSSGLVLISIQDGEDILYSQNFACPECGIIIEELTPRMFSFNNPYGACPTCTGLGNLLNIDPDLLIPDRSLSLLQGAIAIAGWNVEDSDAFGRMLLNALSKHYGFSLDAPVEKLSQKTLDVLLYGTNGEKIEVEYERQYGSGTYKTAFEGLVNMTQRRYRETPTEGMKRYYEGFMDTSSCPECNGARLKKETLAVTVGGLNIQQLTAMPISDTADFIKKLKLTDKERIISDQILKEINARLGFLVDVGLDYLTLSRPAGTLSGGEAQRIRLATQIGSGLMGVLYILDEPSIGLHQKDNSLLINTLKKLRDLGNTLIVVEHDEETMCAADHIIDMGPGAGWHGGYVVAQGTYDDIKNNSESITGQYLKGIKSIPIPVKRHEPNGKWLEVKGARKNNLKNLDVRFPLGVLTCVTGVSGSGKSSLVNEIVSKRLSVELNRARRKYGEHDSIEGIHHLDKVIDIDQSPIGRTPRSNPSTYTGVFDMIRQLFASTNEAKSRGYKPGRFSFNVRGGRCEACQGDGIIKIEMHFLPDVYVPCEVCKGKRYNRETLEVKYKSANIAEVLDMTVEEGCEFFKNIPRIKRKLDTMLDTGLGYVKLGQPSTTLSGGESQRVKLATELSKRSTGRTLYILDEPTTGLHFDDVRKLVQMLQRLVDAGNTVIVIEHNLDVIKVADYIIDLGPEGGNKGGYIISQGTPEEVAKNEKSYTGRYLKKMFERNT